MRAFVVVLAFMGGLAAAQEQEVTITISTGVTTGFTLPAWPSASGGAQTDGAGPSVPPELSSLPPVSISTPYPEATNTLTLTATMQTIISPPGQTGTGYGGPDATGTTPPTVPTAAADKLAMSGAVAGVFGLGAAVIGIM